MKYTTLLLKQSINHFKMQTDFINSLNEDCLTHIVNFINRRDDLLNFRATCKMVKKTIDNSLMNGECANVVRSSMNSLGTTDVTNAKSSLVKLMHSTKAHHESKHYLGVIWNGVEYVDQQFTENNKNKNITLNSCSYPNDVSFFRNAVEISINNHVGVVGGLSKLNLDITYLSNLSIDLNERFNNISLIFLDRVNILDMVPFENCYFIKIEIKNCNELKNIAKLKGKFLDVSRCNNLEKIQDCELDKIGVYHCGELREVSDIITDSQTEIKYCKNLETIHNITSSNVKIFESPLLLSFKSVKCNKLELNYLRSLRIMDDVVANQFDFVFCRVPDTVISTKFNKIYCYDMLFDNLDFFESAKEISFWRCYKLVEIDGIKDKSSVVFNSCPNLRKVTNVSNVGTINFTDCFKLNKINKINNVKVLEVINERQTNNPNYKVTVKNSVNVSVILFNGKMTN